MKPMINLMIMTCILLSTGLFGFCQEVKQNKIVTTIDLGGNGGGYSLNGEVELFEKDNYSLNTRLGFGYIPIKNTQFLAIPFGFNVITGKGKHHFEGGLGLSYIQGMTYRIIQLSNSKEYYSDEAIYFVPSFGYRFDKLSNGFIFKVYYSPLIMIYDLFNKEQFINDATQDVYTFGDATKKDWFDYFYGDDSLPKATSKLVYFGITIGYRF